MMTNIVFDFHADCNGLAHMDCDMLCANRFDPIKSLTRMPHSGERQTMPNHVAGIGKVVTRGR